MFVSLEMIASIFSYLKIFPFIIQTQTTTTPLSNKKKVDDFLHHRQIFLSPLL